MSVMEQKPGRTRRSFTDEFKRDAVAMVLDDGNKIGRRFDPGRPDVALPGRNIPARTSPVSASIATSGWCP